MSATIQKGQQHQMIRLVTQSFCRELLNYGVARQDMVSVSVELLDYVMGHAPDAPAPHELDAFAVDRVVRTGAEGRVYEDVRIAPFFPELLPTVAAWLATSDVQRNFAVWYPEDDAALFRHFFETPSTRYFAIFYRDVFVGLVGGEQIDAAGRKVEMKKFIGEEGYRGLGIGKTATFLWLHHVFEDLGFNKVYIYSLDTNIRNINLNHRLGFEVEGILVEDAFLEGSYRDVVRMSLLRRRWEALFGAGQAASDSSS